MFKKIKENLFKYFGKRKEVEKDENVIEEESEVKVNNTSKVVYDPNVKIRKRLYWIAKNTKSYRIRKKNIKRIANLPLA